MKKFELLICPSSTTEEMFDEMTFESAEQELGTVESMNYFAFETDRERLCFLQGYAAAIGYNGDGAFKTRELKEWTYLCSTSTIWASFDNGTVLAPDSTNAMIKATKQLEYDLRLVNSALEHSDNTASKGFTVDMDFDQIQIELKMN